MSKQEQLFKQTINSAKEEWKDMPEYNNVKREEPFITATFKFKNQEDFDLFNKLIKEHLYNGKKAFDGMQRKTVKSTWFPLTERASNYIYTDES